jgi:hypothetical protein
LGELVKFKISKTNFQINIPGKSIFVRLKLPDSIS